MSLFSCLPSKSETKKHLPKARLTLTLLCLFYTQGPHLLLLLEEALQLLDLLIIVLPLGDDSHSSLQFGFFSHGIITLKTQGTHLRGAQGKARCTEYKGLPWACWDWGKKIRTSGSAQITQEETLKAKMEQRSQAQVPCRTNSDSAENGLPSAWGSGFLRKAKKRPAETTKTCFAAPSTVGVHAGKAAHQVDGLSPLLRCVITPRLTPKPFLREGFDWHLMDHVIGQILFGKESKTQRSKTQKFK